MTVSPDGQSAYVAAQGSDAAAVFDRAPNGTLAQKPAAAGCISETGAGPCSDGAALDGAASVAVSPDGQSAYVASTSVFGGVAVFDREPIPRIPSSVTRPAVLDEPPLPDYHGGLAKCHPSGSPLTARHRLTFTLL